MFFNANSAKSDKSTSNFFCEVDQTSDGEDNYDTKAIALVMKNFKRSFKKNDNLGLAH